MTGKGNCLLTIQNSKFVLESFLRRETRLQNFPQNSRIKDILPTARYANSWGFKPQLKICYVQT
ncbi:hypothetical protein [Anabaena azotica]|uniref:Uncharacterized protein n=1 Tax=Anabaena azotica FACHB-119 TaxID=947527 RepID=A0ABR8DDD5_9NOST|nr:hypothetical protein [Anabaena azotica]MBD2504508.1 hypothetical protein [Anabaena azotica FACHB-119]